MPISSDSELEKAVAEASRLLQEIQDYVGGREPRSSARVQFPRGFIRPVRHHQERLTFILDPVLKRNLGYSLMLSDVYLWITLRTTLSSVASQMVTKAGLFLAGAITESITKHVLKGIASNRPYKERTERLLTDRIISTPMKADLDWIWDMRNNQHLFLVTNVEFGMYSGAHYDRAARTIREFIEALQQRSPNVPGA